jgi:hypothetical protein
MISGRRIGVQFNCLTLQLQLKTQLIQIPYITVTKLIGII